MGGGALPAWVDDYAWTVIAGIVGGAIGAVLHALRPGIAAGSRPPPYAAYPRVWTDIVGGAAAGFLGFGALFVALPLGLFARPIAVSGDPMHQFRSAQQLATTLLIGTIALLPHLLLLGRDYFGPRPAGGSTQKAPPAR